MLAIAYPPDFPMGTGDPNACTTDTMLAQGARCDLSVQYTPTVAGPVTKSVTLKDNTTNVGAGSTV